MLARLRREAAAIAEEIASALDLRGEELPAACVQAVQAFIAFAHGRAVSAPTGLQPRDAARLWLSASSVLRERIVRSARHPSVALELVIALSAFAGEAVADAVAPHTDDDDAARRALADDLIAARLPLHPSASDLLRRLGVEPDADLQVTVASSRVEGTGSEVPLRQIADALTQRLGRPSLVVSRPGEVFAVSGPVRSALRTVDTTATVVGVSTLCHGIGEVARGYAEAHRALLIARASTRGMVALDEVSLIDYLVSLPDGTAEHLARRVASELLDLDARTRDTLLGTLQAYADAGLSVRRAADALVVHPNTVYYRLRHASEVAGRDLRRFADLVDVLCAVRVLGGS